MTDQSGDYKEGICFVISRLGEEGSAERQHADDVLNKIIVPIVKQHGYWPERSDLIAKPGHISSQIIEYLVEAPLVIADLTGQNANVFYEMAIRHVARKPVIPIIDRDESIPFDVETMRTIKFDLSPDGIKQCQEALSNCITTIKAEPMNVENPVTKALSEENAFKVFCWSREAWLTEKLWNIVSGYTEMISRQANEFFLRSAKQFIRTCADALLEAGKGRLTIPQPVEGFLFLRLLKTARPKAKVRAVSIYELWWWESPLGEAYLEENGRQIADIEKQVEIIRIFILHERQVYEQRVKDVISKHCKKGVDVRIAIYEEIEERLRYSYLIVEHGDSGSNRMLAVKSQAVNPVQPRGPELIVDKVAIEDICDDFAELLINSRTARDMYRSEDICGESAHLRSAYETYT